MKKDEEEVVEITVRTKEKGEEGKTERRGQLGNPRAMQRRIFHAAHDTPAGGNTLVRTGHPYACKTDISGSQCGAIPNDTWQAGTYATKPTTGAVNPMGLLQRLPVPRGHLQRIGIDFMTDLPMSEDGHNCIVTFVDYMTKRAHCHACRKTINASAFAQIFIDDIIRLHTLPQAVVSDRNVPFTADYWREIARILQKILLFSTAFHPGMDGLSENSNMTFFRYLCGFATHDQANWDDYLPLVEYAYSSSVHSSTKQKTFELDHRYVLPLPLHLIADLERQQANK